MRRITLALATALVAALPLAAATAARAPQPTGAPMIRHVDMGPGTISASKANFRTEPSQKSKVIRLLKRGEKLTAIEKSKDGKWMKVKVGDKTGWVYAGFVKVG